jgi:hypothetical protein
MKVVPCVSVYLYEKFSEFWTFVRSLYWISIFGRWKILKKIRKVAGPACQWPTTGHGRVSRLARAHARAKTPRWLGHRPPPHTDAIDCATCLPTSTRSTCSRCPCTPPCALSSRCRGPKEKPISFMSLTAAAELSPLRSISRHPPLLQAPSTAARSRRYLLVHLRVVID